MRDVNLPVLQHSLDVGDDVRERASQESDSVEDPEAREYEQDVRRGRSNVNSHDVPARSSRPARTAPRHL